MPTQYNRNRKSKKPKNNAKEAGGILDQRLSLFEKKPVAEAAVTQKKPKRRKKKKKRHVDIENISSPDDMPDMMRNREVSIVQQRASLFEKPTGHTLKVKKRKRKHLRSLATMWENAQVKATLQEVWGEDPSIGHSFYRDGVLADFADFQVEKLAEEMQQAVNEVLHQKETNTLGRLDEVAEEEEEKEEPKELKDGLAIWGIKKAGKKIEYPKEFGDVLEIAHQCFNPEQKKQPYVDQNGAVCEIDVVEMTHIITETGERFNVYRKKAGEPILQSKYPKKGSLKKPAREYEGGELVNNPLFIKVTSEDELEVGEAGEIDEEIVKKTPTSGLEKPEKKKEVAIMITNMDVEADVAGGEEVILEDEENKEEEEEEEEKGMEPDKEKGVHEIKPISENDYESIEFDNEGVQIEDDSDETDSQEVSIGVFDLDGDDIADLSKKSDPSQSFGVSNKFDPSQSSGLSTEGFAQGSGRIHRRAATLQLSFSTKKEMTTEIDSELSLIDEAMISLKASLNHHKKDNMEKEQVINELTEKLIIFEEIVADLKTSINGAENEIGQRDELIDQLSQTIDNRESTITRLEQKRLRERKQEIEQRESLIDGARMKEAQRFAVMLCAMQEQLEFERLHFVKKLKQSERLIMNLKNDLFKSKLANLKF